MQDPGDEQREELECAVGRPGIRDPHGALGCGHRGLDETEGDHRLQHLCPNPGAAAAALLAHALVTVHLLQP